VVRLNGKENEAIKARLTKYLMRMKPHQEVRLEIIS